MPDQIANPYVGPRPFEEEDSYYFFGRNEEISQLTSLVISHRVVLFYAPSGAGKTSLLKAGVIPKLRERKKLQTLPVTRLGGDLPPGVDGDQVENIYVFNALVNLAGKRSQPATQLGLSLRKGLQPYLERKADDQRLRPQLLILDQFEELFTTHPDRYKERADFFLQLQQCLADYPQISLVLSMREDFIANLDSYVVQVPDRLRTRFRMELLSYECALEAVKRPAENAHRPFASGVAEDLVNNLRRLQRGHRRRGQEGTKTFLGNCVEPIQLQIVCRQLWANLPEDNKQIQAEDVRRFGDVDKALMILYRGALEQVLEKTGVEEQRLRAWFDEHLITPDQTRGLVYRGEEETKGLLNDAVDILSGAYVIRAVPRGNDVWYELSHDRLVEPVLADNAAWRQKNLSRFQRQAALWEKEGQPRGLLLSGEDLEEGERWVGSHFSELEQHEKAFLAACREARETAIKLAKEEEEEQRRRELEDARKLAEEAEARRKAEEKARLEAEQRVEERTQAARKLRTRFWIGIAVGVVAGIAAIVALHYSKLARQQTRVATARQLAAQSQATLEKYPQRSLLLAVEALATTVRAGEPSVPAAENALRQALSTVGGTALSGHEGFVSTLAISPDNHWLVTGSSDKTACVWDLKEAAGTPIVLRGHEDGITAVAISPDNRWLVTGSWDKTARLWDLTAKDPAAASVVLRGHQNSIITVAISPDNHWLVTGSLDNTARLWDLTSKDPGAASVVLRGHEDRITAVAISPNNHWLVTGSRDKTACLWDLTSKDPAAKPIILRGHKDGITAVAISPDNRWLLTGSGYKDKTARLWDLNAKDPVAKPIILRGHKDGITAVAISPDNRWLVTGSLDNTARLWDLNAKDPVAKPIILRGHENSIITVAISSDNRWLVTGSLDNTARLWDLNAKDPAAAPVIFSVQETGITAVAISPDNRWLVTGSLDNTARLWDLNAKDPVAKPIILRGHKDEITAVAISPDNRWLVTGSGYKDKTARLWDLNAKDPAAASVVLRGHEEGITAVAISPDNRWLVTGSRDKTARLWDLTAKDPATASVVLRGHEAVITAVAISPDNRWLVTGSWDKTARLWDLNAKDPAAAPVIFSVQETGITAVAISPDNRWLVTGSLDNTARLLSLKDPDAAPIVLRGHEDSITAAAFSRDKRWVVTGSADKTARLWNLKDPAAAPVILTSHENGITGVAFSPDNHWLVTVSGDKTARIWSLKLNELRELACRTAGRPLTKQEWKQYIGEQTYQKTCPNLQEVPEGEKR